MTTKSIGAALALAVVSTTAMAADLPSGRPVYAPPPVPVFTWTGFYLGLQAGYGFGDANAVAFRNANGATVATANPRTQGLVGGGHAGYLFSVRSLPALNGFGGGLGGLVIGVEGDVNGSTIRTNYRLGALNAQIQDEIQGSIRGRLGVAVDRVLFYATGGAAFGGLQNNYFNTAAFDNIGRTRVGYTIGGGIEYGFTPNWSARVEYRYTDYGTYVANLARTRASAVNVRRRDSDNRIQAGISYHFVSFAPVPVVARY